MELPKRSAHIGPKARNALIANLKNWRGIERLLKRRLDQDPVVTACRQDVSEIAIVPRL
jgi:hypothetical protein